MLFIVFSPLFLVFLIRLHLSLIHWVDYFFFFSFVRLLVCSFVDDEFIPRSLFCAINWTMAHNCAWFTFKQNGVHWNGLKQANQVLDVFVDLQCERIRFVYTFLLSYKLPNAHAIVLNATRFICIDASVFVCPKLSKMVFRLHYEEYVA